MAGAKSRGLAEACQANLQDAEKGRQLRSRCAQRLDVRNRVRLASSLAAALSEAFLSILLGQGRYM